MGHSRPLFLYFRLFNTVENKQMFNISFVNDWIRTADLWFWKQPLYQLSHHQLFVCIFLYCFPNGIVNNYFTSSNGCGVTIESVLLQTSTSRLLQFASKPRCSVTKICWPSKYLLVWRGQFASSFGFFVAFPFISLSHSPFQPTSSTSLSLSLLALRLYWFIIHSVTTNYHHCKIVVRQTSKIFIFTLKQMRGRGSRYVGLGVRETVWAWLQRDQ